MTTSNATTITGWQTRLVCLDVAAGGLHLEVGPLDVLPPFVKKLRVVGMDWDTFALAANAKHAPDARAACARERAPGAGRPWASRRSRTSASSRLALDALDATGPIVFRVDADGVGQRIESATLALGQAYRLLLPPTVGDDVGTALDGAWRIWSLDLAAPLSPGTRQALTALGLDVGETWPRLEWALAPSSAWPTNVRGESYPVFEVGTELLVNVGGVSVDEGDVMVLFLHGSMGTERLALSASGLVSLGTPPAGRWACALMHSRTSVQPATLVFEVAENAAQHVAASWTAAAPSGLASLEATAPPGWPVSLGWRVLASHEEFLATLYGNDDRTVPVEGIASLIEARAARARIADIVVDFGELGRRLIPHDGRASVKQVREQLTALWQQRSGLVQSRAGAWLQLMPTWFEPVTALFGYGLEATRLAHTTLSRRTTSQRGCSRSTSGWWAASRALRRASSCSRPTSTPCCVTAACGSTALAPPRRCATRS